MSEIEVFVDRTITISGFSSVDWFIEKHNLKRKDRSLEIKTLRQYLMYLCRKNLKPYKNGYTKIGLRFGKSHATAIHSERYIKELLEIKDKYLRDLIKKHEEDINLINWKIS